MVVGVVVVVVVGVVVVTVAVAVVDVRGIIVIKEATGCNRSVTTSSSGAAVVDAV